jgi:aspartyl-tRNA(Asn)/glutamyl-tRNA(Gln) amidotransferase subunit A
MAASLAGTPAMTVPCGFNKDNLPIGLQIMTGRFREDLMFNVGYAFAQSVPWLTRRPSLATSEF